MRDIVSLGMFDPGFVHGYESYTDDQRALWVSSVIRRVRPIDHTTLPVERFSNLEGEIRTPEWHLDTILGNTDDVIVQWHHDNSQGKNYPDAFAADQWLVVWANVAPTEILMNDGSVYTGQHGEIIAFRNGSYKHRTPHMSDTECAGRWFARTYLTPIPPPNYKIGRDKYGNKTYEPAAHTTPTSMMGGVLDIGVVDKAFLIEMKEAMRKPLLGGQVFE